MPVDNRYTGVGYEPPFETPSDKDFMAAHIESLKEERDQLRARNEALEAEVVQLSGWKKRCIEEGEEVARLFNDKKLLKADYEALERKLAALVEAAERVCSEAKHYDYCTHEGWIRLVELKDTLEAAKTDEGKKEG